MSEANTPATASHSPPSEAFLSVPQSWRLKPRSYSDTAIFKISSSVRLDGDDQEHDEAKGAAATQSGEKSATHKQNRIRKISRPRSPFSGEKALDFLSKFTKDLGKGAGSSPKAVRPTARRPPETVTNMLLFFSPLKLSMFYYRP